MWDCYFLRNILALIFIVASAGVMAIALYWQELKPVRNRCQEVWIYSKKYPVSAFTNALFGILIFGFGVLFYGWLYPFIEELYIDIESQISSVTINSPAFRNVSLSVAGSITLSIAVLGVILTVIRNLLTRQQNRTDEQRLVAEQISRAIEQIGAYKQTASGAMLEPNIDVRLGGLYSLQRIMQDSSRDMLPIARILYAYVRENTRRDKSREPKQKSPHGHETYKLPEDIQSALNIIIQFKKDWKKQFGEFPKDNQLNFSYTDFTEYSLKGMDFSHMILKHADFSHADLSNADFSYADVSRAKLFNSHLLSANFSYANLMTVDLTGAYLTFADLTGADLFQANITDADLTFVNLSGARLLNLNVVGANLASVKNLTQEQIDVVFGTEKTRLPTGLKIKQVRIKGSSSYYRINDENPKTPEEEK